MRRRPTTTTTRAEILEAAQRLRRAALLLEAHARRCTEAEAPAHGEALRQAQGMVRAVVVRTGDTEDMRSENQ
jgi:hypothetical protein